MNPRSDPTSCAGYPTWPASVILPSKLHTRPRLEFQIQTPLALGSEVAAIASHPPAPQATTGAPQPRGPPTSATCHSFPSTDDARNVGGGGTAPGGLPAATKPSGPAARPQISPLYGDAQVSGRSMTSWPSRVIATQPVGAGAST
jgi:hypothetical protein